MSDAPLPPDAQRDGLRRFYDLCAPDYTEIYANARPGYAPHVSAFLARFDAAGMRVLDVGCGNGHLTAGLTRGVTVVGTDLAPAMIDEARRARPSATWLVHDFDQPLPDGIGPFDAAIAMGCLDYAADLARPLGHIARVLTDGGRLLFGVPERRAGVPHHEERTQRLSGAGIDVDLYLHTGDEVRAALARAGLTVEQYAYLPGWRYPVWDDFVMYGLWEVRPS